MKTETKTQDGLIKDAPSVKDLLRSTVMLARGKHKGRTLRMAYFGQHECGTELCFAGNVVYKAGFVPYNINDVDMWANVRVPGTSTTDFGSCIQTFELASTLLEIDDYEEAAELFFSSNDNILDRMAERWPEEMAKLLKEFPEGHSVG